MPFDKGIKLRFAISILVIMTVLCTIIVSGYSSANALKDTMTENYLESNYHYAKKLSLSTSDMLDYMQQNISSIGRLSGYHHLEQADVDQWRNANSNHFNSIFITDASGVIQLISPAIVNFSNKVTSGMKIQSETIKKALLLKEPFISKPYRATSGQLIILISAPIFDAAGNYQGLIGGTIYLESENVIRHLLSEHEYGDGSYVYVVDASGRIVYHPDSSRINELVSDNKVVQKVMAGKSGSAEIVNTQGNEFFAGYAYEENTGWGIVSQTPTSVIEKPLYDLLKKMIFQSLPLLLLIVFIGWLLASNLSKPLNSLAKYSEDAINHKRSAVPFNSIKIKSNIYEVRQLYYHINNYFNLLNYQIQIDGLTGLANRRTFDLVIKEWVDHQIPFSIIMMDIDHFKKVNDMYGHLVGDDVLKYLSSMIQNSSKKDDLCFRFGGEEFGILVKNKNIECAFKVAERLRVQVAETPSPTGEPITISLGISSYQDEDQHPKTIIERADSALFQSKTEGRNRTTIYDHKLGDSPAVR